MRIAFYAPLKSPTHGTPSGDRRVAGCSWRRSRAPAIASSWSRPSAATTATATRRARRRCATQGDRARPAARRAVARRAAAAAARPLVHLPRLLQGARLARARGERGARHPLRDRRGLARRASAPAAPGRSATTARWRRSGAPTCCFARRATTSPACASVAAAPERIACAAAVPRSGAVSRRAARRARRTARASRARTASIPACRGSRSWR